ncbi:MAG: ABC transporter permease [Bacteroidia bacterium]|nr:ABC transporter permease [Bacteroidia bacterium]
MRLLRLILYRLKSKPLYLMVSILLFSFGTGTAIVLQLLSNQMEAERKKNIDEIDMVIGAKGSPLQLILSTVFQIDAPTGNILEVEARKWMKHPMVKKAIPLALGDSYQAFRIVGTTPEYAELYDGTMREGKADTSEMTVVLGAEAAQKTRLKTGDTFFSNHGLTAGESTHEQHPYTVTGILNTTGTVLDRLILTSIESVREVHAHEAQPDSLREITAVLISFKGPAGAVTVPRLVQEYSQFQAAVPAIEWARLQILMGDSFQLLRQLAYLMMILAGISVFVSLYYSMESRKYDIAVMRVMGSNAFQMFFLVIGEGLITGILGAIGGLLFGHLGMEYLGHQLRESYHYPFTGKYWLNSEIYILGAVLITGLIAALIPALLSYKTDISRTLQR